MPKQSPKKPQVIPYSQLDTVAEKIPNTYDQLLNLFFELCQYNANKSGLGEDWYSSLWKENRQKELDRYLANSDAIIHVAIYNAVLVGYSVTYVCHVGAYYVFEELFLLPAYRSKGYGQEFFKVRKAWCFQWKYPIKLEVYSWNKEAISFHEHNGFSFDSLVYYLNSP